MKNQNNEVIEHSYTPSYTNSLIEYNDNELSLVHYILTSEINLGNQKFDLNGYDDTYAKKRPKFLFNHGLNGMYAQEYLDPRIMAMLMLGKNIWISHSNDKLKAKTVFDKDNELAYYLYNGYKNGIWTDFSVFWWLIQKDGITDEDAMEFDANEGIMYVNKFWVREYSSVFEGKDTGAISDMMNNVGDFKTPELKVFLNSLNINKQVGNSEEVETLKTQIAELRTELETNKQEPFDKNGLITELTEYTNKAVLQATKQLVERIKDTNTNLEKVSKITLNNNKELSKLDSINSIIELSVKKEVNGVISQTLGQV